MEEGEPFPTGVYEGIDECRASPVYLENQRRYFLKREIGTDEEYYREIVEKIEEITGPLLDWQIVYAVAAISGRGVEWAQARVNSHYHIVGLSCTICGRG
jgi:hypothetical protein